jgi:hypothetical protein
LYVLGRTINHDFITSIIIHDDNHHTWS